MYMEPEFSKIRSFRNFCKYLYPHYVLKKKCRMCHVLNYHWLKSLYPLSNQFDFEIHIGCILMNYLCLRMQDHM